MNKKEEELFLVGQVVGFRGLKGEMKVRTATNSPELLLDITILIIRPVKGEEFTTTIKSIQSDKKLLLITLPAYKDRTTAEALLGAEFYAKANELKKLIKDEWWVKDLIGLKAFTDSGQLIGSIISIIDGSTQILEIDAGIKDKTILVPFVKQLVPVVDIHAGKIIVSDLPGLLEPQ